MRLFRPHVFQGNLNSKSYFEGWYFKQVTADLENVWSFIPGISLTPSAKTAFIQVIDGISGSTAWFDYPLETFQYDPESMKVKVGNSWFTENGIHLDIQQNGHTFSGELTFDQRVGFPSTLFSPGIMGWYSFVPFMECKHGIVSVNHSLRGSLNLNGRETDFSGGKGYIEKDWGTSFPESWIWIHSNHFDEPGASFMFSVAKIPWLGSYFIGHISYLYAGGEFYRFATYNGSKIKKLTWTENLLTLLVEGRRHLLEVTVTPNKGGHLKAPVSGEMSRIIKESIDSTVSLKLSGKDGGVIFEDTGQRAGFEIIEKIVAYFN
ncbi:MAG: tocopherol cyclase family protein [Bacteroidota bacterium]